MPSDGSELARLLRERQPDLIALWEAEARRLPSARQLSRPALIDHVPELLRQMAEVADARAHGIAAPAPYEDAAEHASTRLGQSYEIAEVIAEYSLLRSCILRLWPRDVLPRDALRVLDSTLDAAVAASVAEYLKERERTAVALDRISTAGLETRDLDELLHKLLAVLLSTTSAIDTTAILLREGECLRVRAAVGLEREVETGFALDVGEGFAGTIAATRQPLHVREPSRGALLKSPLLRARNLKAIYGAPLLSGDELIGVAHIGSLTTLEFSDQEMQLFRAMAARATVAIKATLLAVRDRATNLAARALAGAATVDEAGFALLAEIGDAFAWDVGAFWRVDDGGDELRYARGWKRASVEAPRFIALSEEIALRRGHGLPGRALAAGATVWSPNLRDDPSFPRQATAHAEGLVSGMAIPLVIDARAVGVLELFARAPRYPTSEAVELTTVLSAELGRFMQRLAAAERLQHSEAQKVAMLDAALDCIISMDASGRITAWNPASERTFGWARDEVVGRELAEVIIPPRFRARHRAGLQRYLARGEQQFLDKRVHLAGLRRDGSEFPVELTITRVRGEEPPLFTGYIRDIGEEQRNAEDERFLSDASVKLARTLDYEATLAVVVDTAVPYLGDLCVIDVLDEEGQVRRVASRHVDPAHEATVREIAAHYAARRGSHHAVARVIDSGEPLLVADVTDDEVPRLVVDPRHAALVRQLGVRSLLIVPLVAGARTIGALAFSSRTPKRYGARELRVAQELARRAAAAIGNADEHRRAQRAVRSRENVLAIVSHDLRNPLNTIHMAAAMIAKGAADPRQRKHSEIIARASFRMQHLISDLLDVASIEAGRLRVEPRPHDARELVREALETHEPLAAERGLVVTTTFTLEGVRVLCDRERVLQVLSNLVGNALKFCGSRCSVEIGGRVEGDFVELAVADTGPGIPADELPHLFDPWWSAERHAGKGSGLGLFISRAIVEAHGGKLWVKSEPGAGATFFFTLPLAPPDIAPPEK